MIPPRPTLPQMLAVLAPNEDHEALIDHAVEAADLPWYARVLSGASAWVATSTLLCGVGALGIWVEPLVMPIGLVLLVGGTMLRRALETTTGAPRDFGIQTALIGTLLGRGLVAIELMDGVGDVAMAMIMAALELTLVVVYADRAQRFASTLMAGAWIHVALNEMNLPAVWWTLVPTVLVFAALRYEAESQGREELREVMAPVAYGALAYSWFGLAWCLAEKGGTGLVGPLMLAVAAGGVFSAFRDGAAPRPFFRTPVGLAALALGAPIALALSYGAPGLPVAVGLAIIGFHRRDLLLSGVSTLGILGWTAFFYYDLELALSTKGVLLLASGAVLWLGAGLLRSSDEHPSTLERTPSRGLLAVGLVLPLLVGSVTVLDLERIRILGEPVLLELRPQDPRSMVQGDFMRLATMVERVAERSDDAALGLRGELVLQVDDQGVGRFSRVDDGRELAPDELRLDYRMRHDHVTVGTRSFLFEEGTAKEHQRARYGEYRVLPGGRALLVGLRDSELKPVGTALSAF